MTAVWAKNLLNLQELDLEVRNLKLRLNIIPKEVENLLDVAAIRGLGRSCGIAKIEEREGSILLRPIKFEAVYWMRLAGENKGKLLLNVGANPYVACPTKKSESMLPFLRKLLKRYLDLKTEREAQGEDGTQKNEKK